jgi:hypothetical protein
MAAATAVRRVGRDRGAHRTARCVTRRARDPAARPAADRGAGATRGSGARRGARRSAAVRRRGSWAAAVAFEARAPADGALAHHARPARVTAGAAVRVVGRLVDARSAAVRQAAVALEPAGRAAAIGRGVGGSARAGRRGGCVKAALRVLRARRETGGACAGRARARAYRVRVAGAARGPGRARAARVGAGAGGRRAVGVAAVRAERAGRELPGDARGLPLGAAARACGRADRGRRHPRAALRGRARRRRCDIETAVRVGAALRERLPVLASGARLRALRRHAAARGSAVAQGARLVGPAGRRDDPRAAPVGLALARFCAVRGALLRPGHASRRASVARSIPRASVLPRGCAVRGRVLRGGRTISRCVRPARFGVARLFRIGGDDGCVMAEPGIAHGRDAIRFGLGRVTGCPRISGRSRWERRKAPAGDQRRAQDEAVERAPCAR